MPPILEPPRALEFIYSEANGYRSREKVVIKQPVGAANQVALWPGTLLYPELDPASVPPNQPTGLHLPVIAGGEIDNVNAILMYPVDPRAGNVEAAAFVRDGEVNDAYLVYAFATTAGTAFTPAQVTDAVAALLNMNVIVRLGVLAEALANPPIEPVPPRAPLP
jgi:hypothetical protein